MRHRRSSASLLVAIAATLLAQPAVALEPGVHVNPSSPAGIEYSFPLGTARSELSGQPGSSSATSTSSAPRFGFGITPRGGGAGAGTQGVKPGRRRASAASRSIRRARRSGAQARKLETVTLDGSLGDLVLPLVGGVLLAGALGGWLGSGLRRRAVDS